MSSVKPIPEGYSTVTPYLVMKNAAKAIDYYKQIFGASEMVRMDAGPGKIAHAEIKIGDSVVMLADEYPDMGFTGPETIGGSPVCLLIYVPDVDATFRRAVETGSKQVKPVENQFYGDRSGTLTDPFGHVWCIATHVEDVSPEEMKNRMAAMAH